MGHIHDAIQLLKPQRVHLYSQGWWGSASHINIGYHSDDPAVVSMQVESSQAVVAPAILNTVPAWYSFTNQPNNTYCQLLMAESERRRSQFAIMMPPTPPWVKESPSTLLAYLRKTFFPSPAYARLNGKLMFFSFNASPAILNLMKAQPDVIVLNENQGINSYAWPQGFPPKDTPQKYMEWYLSNSLKSQVAIPCLWRLFDDHNVLNPSESIWPPPSPARYLPAGPTGWDLHNSLVSLIQKWARLLTELGLIGLDDIEEGTRLWSWIYHEYGQMQIDKGQTLIAEAATLQSLNHRKDIG